MGEREREGGREGGKERERELKVTNKSTPLIE